MDLPLGLRTMSSIITATRKEPALVSGFVAAVIALVIAFGPNLSNEQVGAIMAFVAASMAIVTRSQVTPNVSVLERTTDGNEVVAGPANDVVPEGEFIRERFEERDTT